MSCIIFWTSASVIMLSGTWPCNCKSRLFVAAVSAKFDFKNLIVTRVPLWNLSHRFLSGVKFKYNWKLAFFFKLFNQLIDRIPTVLRFRYLDERAFPFSHFTASYLHAIHYFLFRMKKRLKITFFVRYVLSSHADSLNWSVLHVVSFCFALMTSTVASRLHDVILFWASMMECRLSTPAHGAARLELTGDRKQIIF